MSIFQQIQVARRTHLELVDADVVAVVHERRDLEAVQRTHDEFRVRLALELQTRDKHAVVRVSEVLLGASGDQRGCVTGSEGVKRTW